ncbi:hypothetical protein [Zhongshania arctica]|uniref:Uncharacterized protein n=1 Tax=Zhongshania arctica TaxID=3238302 RepID=A0ABV3TZG7_9GAMM
MKYVKYAFISLTLGVFFALGFFLVFAYVVPLFSEADIAAMHRDRIAKIEKEIGESCVEVYSQAYRFSDSEIRGFIQTGENGGDWLADISTKQKTYIDEAADDLWKCKSLGYLAKELGEDWPDFNFIEQLYSSLKIYSEPSSGGRVSSKRWEPEALSNLVTIFQNVTNKGSGTAVPPLL